jgi:endogenous inhibitor of DNA gyrase (YacG/DUF329 family)
MIKNCIRCDSSFATKNNTQRYCSQSCTQLAKSDVKLRRWLAGEYDLAQKTDGAILEWARRYLMEQVQYRCSKCCWSEISANGTIPLEIDHIDGNWKNSNPSNLRVLCPNCHALTANWKIYNKGNEQSRYAYWKERGWH